MVRIALFLSGDIHEGNYIQICCLVFDIEVLKPI